MKHVIIQLLLICCMCTMGYANEVEKVEKLNQVNLEEDTRPKFRIGFDAPQIDHRQLLLTIDDRATDAVDYGFDGEMFEMIEDDMYWLIEDGRYVIQGTNEIAIDKELPLGIIMSAEGEIQITVDELENPVDSLVVYLKDKELNKLYNIQDSAYQTTLSQGEHHTRFVITFKSKDFVNETESPVDEENPVTCNTKKHKVKIFYNHKKSSLVIKNKCEIEISNVLLFDRHGRLVKLWDVQNVSWLISLPIQVKKRGIYYVIAKTEVENYRKKVLIH